MRTVEIFVLVLLLTSLSCDKDTTIVNPLIGSWKYSYENFTQCDDPVDNGQYDYPCDDMDCFTITFSEDFTVTIKTLAGGTLSTAEGTYNIDNGKLTICAAGCDAPVDYIAATETLSLIHEDTAGCIVTKVLVKL